MTSSNLSWQIGAVRVERVEESITSLPIDALLPDATGEVLDQHEWAKHYFTSEGDLRLSIHTFVVTTPDLTIAVDTCVGTAKKRPLPTDPAFIGRLEAVLPGGVAAIDRVVCTHLHFDHCGWNTQLIDGAYVPTFPNARYLITRAELAALDTDEHGGSIKESSVTPIAAAGLLDPVHSDHVLCAEVRLIPTPGHTAGHVSVLIESNGERGLITGDAFHSPIQIARPDIAALPVDHNSEQSRSTRAELLKEFADSDVLVMGTHFAPPTAGHFRSIDGSVRFEGS